MKNQTTFKKGLTFFMALAMTVTSVNLPSIQSEAASAKKVKTLKITNPATKVLVLKKDAKFKLKAKATPSGAKLTYKSSKKKVVTVSPKGVLRAKKNGNAKITVTAKLGSSKKTAKITVKVGNPITKIKATAKTVQVGSTVKVAPTITPSNATYKTLKYTSNNKKVATVTNKGVVKGIAKGTAKITVAAQDGSKKKATCTVTVTEKSTQPTNPDSGKDDPTNPTQAAITLTGLEIKTAPTTTWYLAGDKADTTGLSVQAVYSDNSKKDIDLSKCTVGLRTSSATAKPVDITTDLKTTYKVIVVSYTEGDATVTATQNITVQAIPAVSSVTVTKNPTKTSYTEGDKFDPSGMEVEVAFAKQINKAGDTKKVYSDIAGSSEFKVSTDVLTPDVTNVKIVYTWNGKEEFINIPIVVAAKNPLKSLSAELKSTDLKREGMVFLDDDVTVTATYQDNTTKQISIAECEVSPNPFTLDTKEATISYTYGGITKEAKVSGFKVSKYVEVYSFEDVESSGTLVKRVNETDKSNIPSEEYTKDIVPEYGDGVKGKAIHLNGEYGLRLDKIAGSASKSYSISMWVKADAYKENTPIVQTSASEFGVTNKGMGESWCAIAGNNGSSFGQGTTLKIWSYGADYTHVSLSGKPALSSGENAEWTYLTLVVDGEKSLDADGKEAGYKKGTGLAKVYMDGVLVASGNVQNEKEGYDVTVDGETKHYDMKTYVGVNAWSADKYFQGFVDELVFTSDVMTEEEVVANYNESAEEILKAKTVERIEEVKPASVSVEYGTKEDNVKEKLAEEVEISAVFANGSTGTLETTAADWKIANYSAMESGTYKATYDTENSSYIFAEGLEDITVDVVVGAPATELTGLTVSGSAVTSYVENDAFDVGTATFTAEFSDESTADLGADDLTVSPEILTLDTKKVIVSYTYGSGEGAVVKSVEIPVTVKEEVTKTYTAESDAVLTTEGAVYVPGTLNGKTARTSTATYAEGMVGNAVTVDTSKDSFAFPNTVYGSGNGQITISTWMKAPEGFKEDFWSPILTMSSGDYTLTPDNAELWAGITARNGGNFATVGAERFHPDNGAIDTIGSKKLFKAGEWTYVTIVISQDAKYVESKGKSADEYNKIEIYGNGKLHQRFIIDKRIVTDDLRVYLGVNNWSSDTRQTWTLDELKFTNRALRADEITDAYYAYFLK